MMLSLIAPSPISLRRIAAGIAASVAAVAINLLSGIGLASAADSTTRALREMQIHKVSALGLEIWTENQPEWETTLSVASGHPSFVAQSPSTHHPPTVMSYASWPKEQVATERLQDMSLSAIRRASQNFGLTVGQSRSIQLRPAKYGVLQGFEGDFYGKADGVSMDVKVFVGQAPGRFPVVLSIYTLQGKMKHLQENIRRGWGKLAYLKVEANP